jgi:hypothetical protein
MKTELTVADVVEMPDIGKKPISAKDCETLVDSYDLGFYHGKLKMLSDVSSLPISPEKVVGMVSISEEKLKEILNYAIKPIFDRGIAVGMRKDEGHVEGDLTEERDELVREIISSKSKLLSLRKEI